MWSTVWPPCSLQLFTILYPFSRPISSASLLATLKTLPIRYEFSSSISSAEAIWVLGTIKIWTGAIGFIGLVVPHICRTIAGSDHKKLIVLSALIGSIFLIASDVLARGLFPPVEIPIGIITSLIGGPFFLYLISKKNYTFGGRD